MATTLVTCSLCKLVCKAPDNFPWDAFTCERCGHTTRQRLPLVTNEPLDESDDCYTRYQCLNDIRDDLRAMQRALRSLMSVEGEAHNFYTLALMESVFSELGAVCHQIEGAE